MAQVSNFPLLRHSSATVAGAAAHQNLNPPLADLNAAVFEEEEDFYPIEFAGEEGDSDQVNFVTDFFSSDEQYPHPNFSPFYGLDGGIGFDHVSQLGELSDSALQCAFDSSIGGLQVVGSDSDSDAEGFLRDNEPDLGFGDVPQLGELSDSAVPPIGGLRVVGLESNSDAAGFIMDNEPDLGLGLELGFSDAPQLGELSYSGVPRVFGSSIGGLRVVGLESDSDTEVFDGDDDPFGDPGVPLFWDGTGFEEQGMVNVELEWEEVEEQRVLEGDVLGLVIDRIEELSVSSEISNIEREELGGEVEEEGDRNLDWEFLLAVNNLERDLEFETESFGEYDELFGQLMLNSANPKGSPPTAKSVVENLPIVVLSEELPKQEDLVCAVCKDDILAEDSVTKLPCCHCYHRVCIVPWLCIRNTCPVCRYELPTDDPDYEQRKSHEGGLGLAQDFLVRYTFEPLL